MNTILYAFLLALLIVLILTPIVMKLAKKYGFMDIPKDNRRVHKKPIPLAGGLAMYISSIIAIVVFIGISKEIIGLIIGSTIIVISGLIDDKKGLSPKKKILFQLLASFCLILGGVKIEFFTNPFSIGEGVVFLKFLVIPITIFWIVGVTNIINLIDGLDGLAAGVSLICALSLMIIAYNFGYNQIAVMAAIIAGSCLGFLPYNFNPAKIFMGDTGALFLGFMLSYVSVEGIMKSAAALTIIVPVLILGVPVFDTTFAMIRRKLSGRSIVSADKGHLHHRLLDIGLSQRQTVLVLYGISLIFGILANIVANFKARIGLLIFLIIVIAVIMIAHFTGMFKLKEE